MVDPSKKFMGRALDGLLTRRVLKAADAVFYLTLDEREDLERVGGRDMNLREMTNGVPYAAPWPIPDAMDVLFLGRLHSRKRPLLFVQMADRLVRKGCDARFSIVGPDEGELPRIRSAIRDYALEHRVRYEGAIAPESTRGRIAESSLLVLPSVNEPYPMSVLEAAAVGRPVVITESCGLAPAIQQYGCGQVVGHDLDSLSDAVEGLISNRNELVEAGRRAYEMVKCRFGMEAVGDNWERVVTVFRPPADGVEVSKTA